MIFSVFLFFVSIAFLLPKMCWGKKDHTDDLEFKNSLKLIKYGTLGIKGL